MIGIVGWGTYIPRYRIKTKEIAESWGDDPLRIKDMYLIEEKAVGLFDEDTVTMSVEAGRIAITRAGINAGDIGAIFVGSESKPYAVKPISSILIDALGASHNVFTADLEFACKAGSDSIISAMGLVKSGMIRYGLAIGTDASQGEPGEHLEYSVGTGAAAYVIGSENVVAEIKTVHPFVSDTPDFWRREGYPFPVHGEGFTGEPAYFRHVVTAAKELMSKLGMKPTDFDYAIFHQPNARFPLRAASILGFPLDKVKDGIVVDKIGNTYSAAALMGLANVLEKAKPGAKILMVPFGSGAGANAFYIETTDLITEKARIGKTVEQYLAEKMYIDYSYYLKYRKLIRMH
ncbi:MAG: hydroxymethylglutaryl-CoA synthase [Thermocladium sp.]|jgi:hydroxymethylglutaryl-CoA synthase